MYITHDRSPCLGVASGVARAGGTHPTGMLFFINFKKIVIAAGRGSKKEIFEYNTTVITFYIIYENPGIQEN